MSNRISVVFDADTGSFVANTDNASKAVARSAEAVAKAKNQIVESFKMQVQAAKDVGASAQEMAGIQKRAVEMLANVTETNVDRTINKLDRLSERQKAIAAESKNLNFAAPLPDANAHHTSDRMAASATVRGLDSGNPGIRSVENFLITIPGVGKAMQALFPIIGAAGLAGMLYEMGVAGYEAFEKIRKSAANTREAFAELHDKTAVQIDDLELENQKIQDQIDKLSGHPNNGLALALLEAGSAADKLLVKLRADGKEMEALFKANSTGMTGKLASFFNIGEDTGKQETELENDHRNLLIKVHAIKDDLDKALAKKPDKAGIKAATDIYNAAIKEQYDTLINRYGIEDKRLKAYNAVGAGGFVLPQTKHIANIEGAKDILQSDEKIQTLGVAHGELTGELGGLKQSHERGEAAAKAESARKKAADAQMKGIEDALNQRKRWEQLDVADLLNYYESKLAIAAKYPENVEKINAKLGTLQQEFYKLNDADAKKAVDAQKKQVADTQRAYADMLRLMTEWERQDEARSNSAARLDEAQGRAKIAMNEWSLSQSLATGALTKHDTAIQLAILHAADYAKQLAELDREQKADEQRSTLTDDERETRSNNRDIKRVELISKRDITGAQDGVNIVASTLAGGLKNANAAWVQDARDSSKQVADLYQQALGGINESFVNLMTGEKSNFASMFRGIGKMLATDFLKQIEAPLLNAAGGSSKSSGGFLSSIGGFFGSLFGGHRALGGGVKAGVSYDVGEMGRETFTPSVDGSIAPHNRTSGNIAYYNVQVANGVTPEAMAMHVREALGQFHGQVVRDSVKAVGANQNRNPSSLR